MDRWTLKGIICLTSIWWRGFVEVLRFVSVVRFWFYLICACAKTQTPRKRFYGDLTAQIATDHSELVGML